MLKRERPFDLPLRGGVYITPTLRRRRAGLTELSLGVYLQHRAEIASRPTIESIGRVRNDLVTRVREARCFVRARHPVTREERMMPNLPPGADYAHERSYSLRQYVRSAELYGGYDLVFEEAARDLER